MTCWLLFRVNGLAAKDRRTLRANQLWLLWFAYVAPGGSSFVVVP
jgi:hypothetical protein